MEWVNIGAQDHSTAPNVECIELIPYWECSASHAQRILGLCGMADALECNFFYMGSRSGRRYVWFKKLDEVQIAAIHGANTYTRDPVSYLKKNV